MVLFRAVDIGADLFAMTAACVRAQMLAKQGNREATELADLFCREARQRIALNFTRFYGTNDSRMYKVAGRVLAGEHAWLEQGIIGMPKESNPLAQAAGPQKWKPAARAIDPADSGELLTGRT